MIVIRIAFRVQIKTRQGEHRQDLTIYIISSWQSLAANHQTIFNSQTMFNKLSKQVSWPIYFFY